MSRVAVVTGGTRGIGAAISKGLVAAGYKVAATYHGNDEAAAKFKAETGVNVYKWDVANYDACVAGLAQVATDLGPVDVLVNNAGITKDGMFHKMTPEQWYAVIDTNLNSLFNMCRPVIEGMRERKFGRIINISSINGQKGQMGQVELFRRQGRRPRLHQGARAGERQQGRHRQRDLPRLYRHRDGDGGAQGRAGEVDPAADPGAPPRPARGDRRAAWSSSPPTTRASSRVRRSANGGQPMT